MIRILILLTSMYASGMVSCINSVQLPSSGNNSSSVKVSSSTAQGMGSNVSRSDDYYREANVLRWDVDGRGTFVEARVETIKVTVDKLPTGLSFSHLTIKSLTTGSLIYQEEIDGFPISAYTLDVNGDRTPDLVTTWTAGTVAERLQIFNVSATQAGVLFNESYRVDASLLNLSEGALDIFVTTAEFGTGPFYTTRYVWDGESYRAIGKVAHSSFINTIKHQFNAKQP